jgi:[ribosomal protein S18]-alanine N-acetyltransferase
MVMNNINVVKMSLENIDDIMIVENLSFKIPWSRNAFMEEVTNNQFARYIMADLSDKVVGYAGLWKIFDEGHITNIAVHPEFRGNGIGSKLLRELICLAKNEGITCLTLEVRKSNQTAQALYNKFGFVAEGIRKSYYTDNGEDAIIMWKHEV